ncbi:MAG: GNAT family N-acetyltransferase [Chitinivibrionia bacterium]|nr:GNAT family N-acetyltransferase [Chitinivibrionia bacterium]
MYNISDVKYRIIRLEEDTDIKPFDCGDNELNDFLYNDAKQYHKSLLAVTYLLENDADTIGYYSLLNDKMEKNEESKSIWNRLSRKVAFNKRRKTYPAVKIGRLAVSEKYRGLKFGSAIIDYVIGSYTDKNQVAGCRFITVDAYSKAVSFYEKNDFICLTNKDINEDTRTMFFDLMTI